MHRSNSNSSKYKQSLINRFELEYKSVSVRDLQKLSAAMYRLLAVNDKLMENLQTLPMHYRAQINMLKKISASQTANNRRTQRQIVSLFVALCLFS
ncbi:hypothetical protein [Helicoverpa armigera NPV NNg1]|uniref:Uncharacterized protein n=1 Tax=Helicoverpa armigera NPV NNg1 TaxID=566972 RepID=B5X0C9_9ABAC|nr:hypothetical protein [Helicoverpa armigera NPV NNg1]